MTFAFPVILTNLGQQFYQIADAAIVGRGVGVDALAAVGCTDWTYWMILWSMSVMTAGFATFVSRFFGMQDYEKMNRSILISAVLSAAIAIVLTVAGLVLTRPLLEFLGTPANILEDAVIYLSTMIVQSTINVQGSAFIAGYTAINKLYGLLECTAISMGNAFTTFASQNFGAGNFERVRKGVNTAMLLAVGSALVIMAIVLPLNRVLPQLFMDVSETGAAEALDVACRYLINMILAMPVLYLVYVHRNNLQAIGVASWSLISGIAEALVRVIMAKIFFRYLGTEVLYYIEPFAWLAAWLFVMIPYYFYQSKRLPVK